MEGVRVESLLVTEGLNATPLVLRSRGQVLLSDDIQFDNVPIVTPNGDILLRNLTFNVKPGVSSSIIQDVGSHTEQYSKEHLLIVGPNGMHRSFRGYFRLKMIPRCWKVLVVPHLRRPLACLW